MRTVKSARRTGIRAREESVIEIRRVMAELADARLAREQLQSLALSAQQQRDLLRREQAAMVERLARLQAETDRRLAAADARTSALREELDQQKARARDFKAQLQKAREKLEQLATELRARDAALNEMHSSLAWKLYAGLAGLKRRN
jgi:chromosome segregation ATPase